MERTRSRNELLAAVMAEAAISNKGLAARVRQEAERAGLGIAPDHGSVRKWLDGTRPRNETIACITAALSLKLGRPVSKSEIGYDDEAAEPAESQDLVDDGAEYQPSPDRAVDLLDKLTDADLSGNPKVMQSPWVADAAPQLITRHLFAAALWTPDEPDAHSDGRSAAERIRATVRSITELDFQYGGGHVRNMLLAYWKSEVVPELRNDCRPIVRRELFAAAADAAEVLGWSAYDAGHHGAAQRYFIQGLRLAREADDAMMAGQILANLSHQANYLGQFSDALHLARAAQSATHRKTTATVHAMFLTMEARALASMGDRIGCVAALHEAERVFESRQVGADPDWIGYFDELELAGEAAHCFRDLKRPSETVRFAEQAIDSVRTPPRTQAFISMVSAAGHLESGDFDAAILLAVESLQAAGSLKSDRYTRYIRDFHAAIPQASRTTPVARQFADLLSAKQPHVTRGTS